jgi:hypothetical protein
MTDEAEQSIRSRGYADARLVERAFREVIEGIHELSRHHSMNYTGLLYALLLKGVITPEELEAGREKARPAVDEHFGPTLSEKKAKELQELFERFKPKA